MSSGGSGRRPNGTNSESDDVIYESGSGSGGGGTVFDPVDTGYKPTGPEDQTPAIEFEAPVESSAPKALSASDPEAQEAMGNAQAAVRKPRGRAATRFTGSSGASDYGLSLSRRTLLGY